MKVGNFRRLSNKTGACPPSARSCHPVWSPPGRAVPWSGAGTTWRSVPASSLQDS